MPRIVIVSFCGRQFRCVCSSRDLRDVQISQIKPNNELDPCKILDDVHDALQANFCLHFGVIKLQSEVTNTSGQQENAITTM